MHDQNDMFSMPSLRLAWWNTHLSPWKGKHVPTEDAWTIARMVVRSLLEQHRTDVLALGEVTPEVIERIRPCDLGRLEVFREDKPGMRMGLFFDSEKIAILDSRMLETVYVGKMLRRALELTTAFIETNTTAWLFLVHWPSRREADAALKRNALGHGLQTRIREIRRNHGDAAPIIVMGDFNDEPFNRSVCSMLQGSRDRTLVQARPDLLYNPFWRHLGERQSILQERTLPLSAGTYFYRNGLLTHWFTFDQILVSKSLLGGNDWVLLEEGTGICHSPELLHKGKINREFDHLPVIATLVQENARREEAQYG